MVAVSEAAYCRVPILWFFSCHIRQPVPTFGVVVKIKHKGFEQYLMQSKFSVNDHYH